MPGLHETLSPGQSAHAHQGWQECLFNLDSFRGDRTVEKPLLESVENYSLILNSY